MIAFYVFLGVIGYVVGGLGTSLLSIIQERMDAGYVPRVDEPTAVAMGIIWPLALPVILFKFLLRAVVKALGW